MAKVLLGHHNIENYIDRKAKSIRVDGSFIIPPGMKDYLQTEGISLVYEKFGEVKDSLQIKHDPLEPSVEQDNCISEEAVGILTKRIITILKEKHQMADEETIKRICMNVINQIN